MDIELGRGQLPVTLQAEQLIDNTDLGVVNRRGVLT